MESVIIELKVNKGESISGVNVVLFIFKRNKEFSSAATISSNSIFQWAFLYVHGSTILNSLKIKLTSL